QTAVVDDLDRCADAVEQTEDSVHLVGNVGEPLGEHAVIDLEDGIEGGKLLRQAGPLVEAPHSLHQESGGRESDGVATANVAPLDIEASVGPGQEAVD